MATLALSVVGQFAGGLVGGPIGATIGRALGALAGSAVDSALFGEKRGAEGPMFDVRLGGSSEGVPIPRLYGWGRLSGNIIWARELLREVAETAGSKGFGRPTEQNEEILASFAIAFCEGPVARMGRIWADGQLLDTRKLTLRFYSGDDAQLPDSLIEAVQGAGNAPAYRGLCYLVVENLPLSRFGNRIPQLSVELCRVVGELEPAIRAVTVIPGATEFGYDPVPRVRVLRAGEGVSENAHLQAGVSNWTWSIDELTALCPNLKHVALVVSWFGNDLRCGSCSVMPRVEGATRTIKDTTWGVAGYGREDVPVVSSHAGGPAYGGTPSDASVCAAIADLRARGLKVTLYPLLMMDVPTGNGMSDPYGAAEQGPYPWRGRITCHPAPGLPGSPDGTGSAAAQVAAFMPGYRAMVLHYANLAKAAGVETLLIGSEMRGLTSVRGAANSFPFVSALVTLAADVRAIVGAGTKLSYAADWSEYSGYQVGGEKFFHLDPLWASPNIDAIGIDNYMPLSDWRDGESHADDALAPSTYNLEYLAGNIDGGEGFDWFYASDADRRAQMRTPISDGAYGEPFVWRYKDLYAFWNERHYNRPGGVRSASPTAWVPRSKPIWMTELGCGAVDKGANQPNIFGDAKSAEGGRPYFSSGLPDGLIQRQFLRAHHRHWNSPATNPIGMVDPERIYCWTWDARPYPSFPSRQDIWSDGPNYHNGHWLTGRLGGLASDELIGAMGADHGTVIDANASGALIGGIVVNGPGTARQAIEPVLDIAGQVLVARNGTISTQIAGRGDDAVLDIDRLADNGGPILSRRRGDSAERPTRLGFGYFDRQRDYLSAHATALRPDNGPLVAENLPIALDGAAARRAAEHLLNRRAGIGEKVEFSLPPGNVALEPGDRISLTGLSGGPFEITEIRDGGVRRVMASVIGRGEAISVNADMPKSVANEPAAEMVPIVLAAHLPPTPDDPLRSRLLIAGYAKPWPGSLRIHDEATGAALAQVTRPASIGETLSTLGPGPFAVWDLGQGLEIELGAGHLADIPDLAALAGSNRIAVETDGGGWEIIGFAQAELTAARRYRLTRLLRGLDGTDATMGPISAGRRLIVMEAGGHLLPIDGHRIGESRALRIYAGPNDDLGQVIVVEPDPGPALPLAPVHLRASRVSDGAIHLAWTRRSRADGDGWGIAEPPLEHVPERWRISIFDGGTSVRIIEAGSTSASYGAGEQVADFGGPAGPFTFTVAQISPVLGAGYAASGGFDG